MTQAFATKGDIAEGESAGVPYSRTSVRRLRPSYCCSGSAWSFGSGWWRNAGGDQIATSRRALPPPIAASCASRPTSGCRFRLPDGTLFGTLCGFDPNRQPSALRDAEQLVLLQARLLATVLGARVLSSVARESDLVARLGGDEGVHAAAGSLDAARQDADRSMYKDKQRRNAK